MDVLTLGTDAIAPRYDAAALELFHSKDHAAGLNPWVVVGTATNETARARWSDRDPSLSREIWTSRANPIVELRLHSATASQAVMARLPWRKEGHPHHQYRENGSDKYGSRRSALTFRLWPPLWRPPASQLASRRASDRVSPAVSVRVAAARNRAVAS